MNHFLQISVRTSEKEISTPLYFTITVVLLQWPMLFFKTQHGKAMRKNVPQEKAYTVNTV